MKFALGQRLEFACMQSELFVGKKRYFMRIKTFAFL